VRIWFEVISELFVNIAAAWFAFVFIENQLSTIHSVEDVFGLILRTLLGILSLFIAKFLREKARKK